MIRTTLTNDKGVEDLESLCIYSYRLLPHDEFTKKLETIPPLLRDRAIQYHYIERRNRSDEYIMILYTGNNNKMEIQLQVGRDEVRISFHCNYGFTLGHVKYPQINDESQHLNGTTIPRTMFMDMFVHVIKMLKQERQERLVIDLKEIDEVDRYRIYTSIDYFGKIYELYTKVLTQYHRDIMTMWITNVVGI